jgi:competence protein ComEA
MLQRVSRSFVKCVLVTSALWASACFAVDVNRASEAELDGIKGLGPSSTARILKAREAGPFKSWADFMARVKGVKSATATKLSAAGLTVGDAPYPSKDGK